MLPLTWTQQTYHYYVYNISIYTNALNNFKKNKFKLKEKHIKRGKGDINKHCLKINKNIIQLN